MSDKNKLQQYLDDIDIALADAGPSAPTTVGEIVSPAKDGDELPEHLLDDLRTQANIAHARGPVDHPTGEAAAAAAARSAATRILGGEQ